MAERDTHLSEDEPRPTMADFDRIRGMITGTVLLLSTIIGAAVWVFSDSIWLAAATFALLSGGFLIEAIKDIDPQNNQVAIPIVNNKLVNRLLGSGWKFIPLRGFFFLDVMRLSGMSFSTRFDSIVILPDDKEINDPAQIYWIIDPYNPIPFVRLGSNQTERLMELNQRLQEQIGQRLRQWLCSTTEGPRTLEQARQMRDEEMLAILEKISGDDISRLHPDLTNEQIFGFLKKYPWMEAEKEARKKFRALSEEERNALLEGAKNHLLKLVDDARNGHAKIRLVDLGIIVTRFGVSNIEPTPETKAGMLKVSAADWDAQAQAKTAASVAAEAELYAKTSPIPIDATKYALIRRGIVKEKIKQNEIKLSPNVTDAVLALGAQLLSKLPGGTAGGKDTNNGPGNSGGAGSPVNP